MTKQEFLTELQHRLNGLPHNDMEERLIFYSEMVDDRMEEGLTEEEAVAELGSIDEIIAHVMSEIPLSRLVKEKVKTRPVLETWQIILIVLSAVVWVPLLGGILSTLCSIYAAIWSMVFLLWVVDLAFGIKALVDIYSFLTAVLHGSIWYGFTELGRALIFAGVTILLFLTAKAASKAVILFTKKIFLSMKSRLIKKEDVR